MPYDWLEQINTGMYCKIAAWGLFSVKSGKNVGCVEKMH